ncbi:MAG: aspartyl-phosphate phosphatase Spo0E family protein [Bacillota bacterium]
MGLFKLHLQVEKYRLILSDLATRYGRDDPRVLAASRRLDRLIVELQRRKALG